MLAASTDQLEPNTPAYLRRTTYDCPSICMDRYNYDDKTEDYGYAVSILWQ